MANKKSENVNRTGAQVRSAAKDGKVQKLRRRASWWFLPCFLCGFDMYAGTDRTGRAEDDFTIGHNLPHSKGGSYAWNNTHPACYTCNKATGTRDLSGMVPCGPEWMSERDAIAFLTEEDFAEVHVRTGIGAAERNASRKARFGW